MSLVSSLFYECSRARLLAFGPLWMLILLAIVALGTLVSAMDGPPLTVDSPVEDLVTGDSMIWVNGTTDPGIEVSVLVETIFHDNYNNTTSGPDGRFEMVTYLVHKNNIVTVTAEGPNGTSKVVRMVTLDYYRPQIEVRMEFVGGIPVPFNEERGGYVVSEGEIYLNGTYMDIPGRNPPVTIHVNGVLWEPGDHPYGTFYVPVALEEGVNNILIEATDQVGNVGYDILVIERDTIVPFIDIVNPEDRSLTNVTYCLLAGTSEAGTYLEVSVRTTEDERTYETVTAADGGFELTMELFEGLQTVTVAAIDVVGNTNLSYLVITLDSVAPGLSIDRPPGGTAVTNADVFTIKGSTDPDAVVNIDGVPVDNFGVFQHQVALVEGPNLFQVRSVDAAGNEDSLQVGIVRDTVAPILFIVCPQRTWIVTNGSLLHLEGSVKGSEGIKVKHHGGVAEASLLSGTWEDGEWAFDLHLKEHGLEQDVEVYAFDQAGNRDISMITVVMDTVPPALNVDGRTEWVTNLGTVRITGTTDEDIGELKVNGEPHPVLNGIFDMEVDLTEGENVFHILVTDGAGNSAARTVTVTYDNLSPELKLEYSTWTETGLVMISGTTDQDVKYVFVDGQSFFVDNGTFSFIIQLEGKGEHRINITVQDEAGNERTRFATVDYRTRYSGLWFVLVPIILFGIIALVLYKKGRNGPRPELSVL